MKMFDIRRFVTMKVTKYLRLGYILVDDDSSFGHICRYDLMEPGAKTKIRIYLEDEREYDDHYLNKVTLKIVEMPKEDSFVRDYDTEIFTMTYYSLARARDWYTNDREEAIAAVEKMGARYGNRYHRDTLLTTPISNNLIRLLRNVKGFGKCNASNTKVWRTSIGYKVETVFAGRTHTKIFKFPTKTDA